MAGVVHVPFYATVFRSDKLETAVAEMAPVSLRYGAISYAVHRNRDDRHKILFFAFFENKLDWDKFWDGPEMRHFRIVNQSYYQVPLLYSWNDVSAEGQLTPEAEHVTHEPGTLPPAGEVGAAL
jgi:quinol monooxygenase YgiN